jgi:hypothetical protein
MMNGPAPASFPHESHLDPIRWLRLVERDQPVPGWVQRGSQVKAINGQVTIATYHGVPEAAPLPYGSSWSNLDHCGGWTRKWFRSDDTAVVSDLALIERVVAGVKLCGQALASVDGSSQWDPSLSDIEALVGGAPGFELRIADHFRPGLVTVWVAPRRLLGEMLDVEPVADFYDRFGAGDEIRQLAGLYLPEVQAHAGEWMDIFEPFSAPQVGLVLGYPPASTVSEIELHGQ